MFKHYLTVAFRNLWKYKSQTLISVVGLAVGFTCFALATLWIRYEMTYDSFHKNADRIYCVSKLGASIFDPNETTRILPYQLAAYLEETFPEISHAIPITPYYLFDKIKIEEVEYPAHVFRIDSTFFNMFDVKIVAGNRDFLIPKGHKAAITREKALQLFGKEDPIGKTFKRWSEEWTICAIITGLPKRSNYPFDFLYSLDKDGQWNSSQSEILIELASGVDVEAFGKKFYEHKIEKSYTTISKLSITPLKSIRYKDLNILREVKFEHIKLFALAGVLVILCSLFNYLTLFISRFRMRQKELALRQVCGASERSLFALLSVEFILTLLISLCFGLIFIQLVHHPFQALSEIQMELSAIYGETLLYIGVVILFSLLSFWMVLAVFRHRTINSVIRKGKKNVFRKVSVVVQLIISIGFAFCSIVIVKQMYFLHNSANLGFTFKNRATIGIWFEKPDDIGVLENKIKQIPEIKETISGIQSLVPMNIRRMRSIDKWDGQQNDAQKIDIEDLQIT
jgi:ABC-type multidrug transport system fused ATPase/permease subunit